MPSPRIGCRTGESANGARHVRLVCKARRCGDRRECRASAHDREPRFARSHLATELLRAHTICGSEPARHRFARDAGVLGPCSERARAPGGELGGQLIGPVARARASGARRRARERRRLGEIALRRARDRIDVGERIHAAEPVDVVPRQPEDLRAGGAHAVRVAVERRLDEQVAGGDAHAPRVARLLEAAAQDDDRVRFEVLVARPVEPGREIFAAGAHAAQAITFVQDTLRRAGYDGCMRRTSAIAFATAAACTHAAGNPTATLRAQTQALLDGIAVGDRALWERTLDPRATYVSENGTIDTRATLLPQLEPLPPGVSGKLVIDTFAVQQFGDTAVTVYTARESESYFGQALASTYLISDTWRRGGAGWMLVMSHVTVKLVDPPAIALPPAQLADYVGTYRLTDAIAYTISRDGDGLVGVRTGRKPQPLKVEVRDVLFVPGQPRSRKVFTRDASGRITGFRDRREGHDVVWQRSPEPQRSLD